MFTRFRLAVCLASLLALMMSREPAAAAYRADPAIASNFAHSADGPIGQLAQDDQSGKAAQTPDSSSSGGDDSSQSAPPPENPQ